MTKIHSTAIVSPNAQLDDSVEVGPYSIIHDHVHIAAETKICSHSVIQPFVRIGVGNQISDHVVLGGAPQDISYHGQETWLEIGNKNVFREFSTVHRSNCEDEVTKIGDDCFIMSNAHVGHNCIIGDQVIITSFAGLSGHVQVDDKAIIGAQAGIHQFCRVGTYAMVAGAVAVTKDVMPYSLLGRDPVGHYRLNTIGLRRAGITGDRYKMLEQKFRELREGNKEFPEKASPELEVLKFWFESKSKRGIHKFIR